jgi:ferritin-like metal-binding protein YciE
MKVPTFDDLLVDQLKDLFSAESQLVKALPRMVKAAENSDLKEAIQDHLEQTRKHVERLESIGRQLDVKLTGKKCKAMEGLLEEAKEVLELEASPAIVDFSIITAAQRVEHYEISGYGTARALAEFLGYQKVVKLLTQTLEEESAADEALTEITTQYILTEDANMAEDDVLEAAY